MELRHGGEQWAPVREAAERLGVDESAIHARTHHGHLETRTIGGDVCVRAADLEHWREHGLPYPDLEALERGDLLPIPPTWATLTPPGLGPHGFVALKRLAMGSHPARWLQPGDILSEEVGAGSPLDAMTARGDVACLPLDRGVLALVRVLQGRQTVLELQLAVFLAASERRTKSRVLTDELVGRGIVLEEQVQAARDYLARPSDPMRAADAMHEFVDETAASLPRAEVVRP